MNKKEAIKAIDKAIELQHLHYQRFGNTIGNCLYLNSVESDSYYLINLFIELFKPKDATDENWMRLTIDLKFMLAQKQIYEDRITALLFLKEYVKQHGVNI